MSTLEQLRAGELAGATRLDFQCGLTEFPREIFDLADSLEVLNLTGNRLRALPDDLGRLTKLRILFCSENEFDHLPACLGECPNLSMIGFKANQISRIEDDALPPALRWLILTDNRLEKIHPALGNCAHLQKLMLSGNRLSELPESLAGCTRIELLRIAANDFQTLPAWLLELPRLSWLAFAGNPCSALNRSDSTPLPSIPWNRLTLDAKLGEGASGSIHRAVWQQDESQSVQHVAVKLFKGAMTSDGLPGCEMDASIAAGLHEHLIPMHGRLTGHPGGTDGLVMVLIDPAYTTLAGPPSFESCTRDVYAAGLRLAPDTALSIALGTASAARHLHSLGINHGDLYAHNILWRPEGHSYLGDFGGASFYASDESPTARALQRIEARAFGCLLEELMLHTSWTEDTRDLQSALQALHQRCLTPALCERPLFDEIVAELRRLAGR